MTARELTGKFLFLPWSNMKKDRNIEHGNAKKNNQNMIGVKSYKYSRESSTAINSSKLSHNQSLLIRNKWKIWLFVFLIVWLLLYWHYPLFCQCVDYWYRCLLKFFIFNNSHKSKGRFLSWNHNPRTRQSAHDLFCDP